MFVKIKDLIPQLARLLLNNHILTLDSYIIYRRDRKDQKGGGVLFGRSKSLKSNVYFVDNSIEFLTVEIKQLSLCLCIVYFPAPSEELFNNLFKIIENFILGKFKYIVLTGDFNIPINSWEDIELSDSGLKRAFFDLCVSHNPLYQLIDFATRKDHILDLLFVNNLSMCSGAKLLFPLSSSDHSLFTFNLSFEKFSNSDTKQVFYSYVNCKKIKSETLTKINSLVSRDV